MITIKHGDLFEEFQSLDNVILCHGCNCHNVMGAGIAKFISNVYPESLHADTVAHKGIKNKFELLGKASFTDVKGESGKYIGNLYTQFNLGADFKLENLISSLSELTQFIKKNNIKKVIFPAIGCGIGGGNFYQVVSAITAWYDYYIPIDVDVSIYFPG